MVRIAAAYSNLLRGHHKSTIAERVEAKPLGASRSLPETSPCTDCKSASSEVVRFWDPEGRDGQTFDDYANDPKIKDRRAVDQRGVGALTRG